jgi:hypothetical protein
MAWRNKTVGDIENTAKRRLALCALLLPFAIVTVGISIGAGLSGILREQVRLYQAFAEGWRK